jgi:catechol-2,3-dioxygenase
MPPVWPVVRHRRSENYHLAWEAATFAELAGIRAKLAERGAPVGASGHRVSKSLYAKDPNGIEFEVMWRARRGAGAGDGGRIGCAT